jgi:hypothetical protein
MFEQVLPFCGFPLDDIDRRIARAGGCIAETGNLKRIWGLTMQDRLRYLSGLDFKGACSCRLED